MTTLKTAKGILAALLAAVTVLTAAGCSSGQEVEKTYTYNTYTDLAPSDWNVLTYRDHRASQILNYIGSNFFAYDFKFDAEGNILPGEFVVKYDAATKLEDISASVDAKWGIGADEVGRAYRITLREDLKWDDGSAIRAEDFVYSMQQLLDPLFQNYRMDAFCSGPTALVNAGAYVKQGQNIQLDNAAQNRYTLAELVKGENGVYTQPDGRPIRFALNTPLHWCEGKTLSQYAGYLDKASFAALMALADENGYVEVTQQTIGLMSAMISVDSWGNEGMDYVVKYMVYESTRPALDFSEVGIYAHSEHELVLILEKPLELLKEDGTLSYRAAYALASLPLVHRETYEASKCAPNQTAGLWTTSYNTAAGSTASWGPYRLESFQADSQYVLVKNEHWYGYALEENKGLYQTDRMVCSIVREWNSAWQLFQSGELDSINLSASVADAYLDSPQACLTPEDVVVSLQLQSDVAQLKAREQEGINKTLLGYEDFRKALSLSIHRADLVQQTSAAAEVGLGLFNSMHFYDVENGEVYRDTDEAKKALCRVYGVDSAQYDSLDAAVAAITGYDLEQARRLVTKAYQEALAAGDIKERDKVRLSFGAGAVSETVRLRFRYIMAAWEELVKTTPLEGRLEFEEIGEFGDRWADAFREGAYDVCIGSWSGGAWDPGYLLGVYLRGAHMYSAAWATDKQEMTFTVRGVGENGADVTATMSLLAWYDCLNGAVGAKYDWSEAAVGSERRLPLIAALEEQILKAYYTLPLYNLVSASLQSYQVKPVTREHHSFLGNGGIKYLRYHFDDAAWAAQIRKNGGELDYT